MGYGPTYGEVHVRAGPRECRSTRASGAGLAGVEVRGPATRPQERDRRPGARPGRAISPDAEGRWLVDGQGRPMGGRRAWRASGLRAPSRGEPSMIHLDTSFLIRALCPG